MRYPIADTLGESCESSTVKRYGWTEEQSKLFAVHAEHGRLPARVVREDGQVYEVCSDLGCCRAEVSGRLWYQADARSQFPVIGDWVAIRAIAGERKAVIDAILPRQTRFSRKEAGGATREQVIAANVDVCYVVVGLDQDFNLRRLERYLVLASESGAEPVVVLNKADLLDPAGLQRCIAETRVVAPGVVILPVSATSVSGLDGIELQLEGGRTGVLLGSSGVGKSSLLNAILGDGRQVVGDLRRGDGKGRHTTTHRQLFVLPQGGLMIDSPGMRELQLWAHGDALDDTFDDIDRMAVACRFRDCRHLSEPGCAIKDGLANGTLDANRYHNYLALGRELRWLERRKDQQAILEERARWKRISKQCRKVKIRR